MARNIFLLLSLSFLVISCDPCTECDPVYEASVEIKLINARRLKMTNDSLVVVDTLIIATKRLVKVEELIALGDLEFEEERLKILEAIDAKTNIRPFVENLLDYLNENKADLKAIITIINNGKVRPNEIHLVNTGNSVFYEDSLSSFNLPLVEARSVCDYTIDIEDLVYELSISYDLSRDFSKEHRISQAASGIEALMYSFDSVKTVCETPECLNGQTTITCYF